MIPALIHLCGRQASRTADLQLLADSPKSGSETLRNKAEKPPEAEHLGEILHVLEQQLALLDDAGALIPAAHVSAAVEHLRFDLLVAHLPQATCH